MKVAAIDVTAEFRAAGGTTPGAVAVSAGVAGAIYDADRAVMQRSLGQLARLAVEAPGYERQRLDETREAVTSPHGRRWIVIRSTSVDGDEPRTLVLWAFEWGLLDGDIEAVVFARDAVARRLN